MLTTSLHYHDCPTFNIPEEPGATHVPLKLRQDKNRASETTAGDNYTRPINRGETTNIPTDV